EEERFIPLVDDVDKLIQLHPKDRIWLEGEVGAVVITGRVVLREGMLELFACKVNSKEHESIISIRVLPELIHAALLAVGAENGKPVQMKPEFVAPSGDEIEVRVKWRGQDGQIKESSAQDWIWDNANSKEDDKKPMKTNWVFTGSQQYKDEEGNNHYLANETGELFGLSNFVGSILDVPIQSSADNDKLMFSCLTEKIPPLGTLVTIILKPTKNK
ncbi:MAG: YdjY domain-containing protein, partial [Planctomycetaceae bacterium]|nr:YdjY domain-containing protein [Planctomycetaceae bacterium]